MPRGAKPKVYPSDVVSAVRSMYADGKTQTEIAASLNLTQKVIWRLMMRHGIKARVAAKRDQLGSNNHAWKGDSAAYAALHPRVASVRGKPSICEWCKTSTAKVFDWANLTGNYADVNDYVRLCRSCHARMDNSAKNFNGKEVLNARD